MEASRSSWAGSHRQLWTSSSDAGQRLSGVNSLVQDLSADASTLPSAIDSMDHEDTIAMVMRECQESGGALLSSRSESSLASLLSAPSTENRVKSLVSVILATNAKRRRESLERSKKDTESEASREKLRQVVSEITARLRGESLEADEDVEDSLYRVLLDTEKCTELAQMVTKVSHPCLRDVLLEACGQVAPRSAAPLVEAEVGVETTRPSADLASALEILDTHGYVDPDDDRDVSRAVLRAIKTVEELKREVSFRDVLLRRYEGTVRERLAIYGEANAPRVDCERARLTASSSSSSSAAVEGGPWWEERLRRMCDHLSRIPHRDVAETLPAAGSLDISTNAETTQSSIASLLDTMDACLVGLLREVSASKKALLRLAGQLRSAMLLPGDAAHPDFLKQLPVSAALDRLGSDLTTALGLAPSKVKAGSQRGERGSNGNECGSDEDTEDAGGVIPPSKLLGLVVECLPTTVRAKFNMEKHGVFDEKRATQLLSAINFLNEHNRDTIRRIDDLCDRLRATFGIGRGTSNGARDLTLADQLSFLEDAVSAACRRSVEAVSSESSLSREVRQSIEELAQLLPIAESPLPPPQLLSDSASARVAPPTDDLLHMTHILKLRLVDWQQSQAKRNVLAGRLRTEKLRLEEDVRSFTAAAQPLVTEMITGPAPHGDADAGVDDRSHTAVAAEVSQLLADVASADVTLGDVLERIKVAKARYVRAMQANSSLRARADAAVAQSRASQKLMRKVASAVATICSSLGIRAESYGGTPADGGDTAGETRKSSRDVGSQEKGTYARLNLRPDRPPPPGWISSPPPLPRPPTGATSSTARIAEERILDALQCVAARVAADEALVRKSISEGELERLQAVERRAESDTAAFRQAIAMLLTRLAENGQMMKQSLYLLGTDESPNDEVVESVLRKGKGDAPAASKSGEGSAEEEHESNERRLAALMQKYARWSRRLIETTEDHLDTQQKIVKYFAAVRRYFASQDAKGGDGGEAGAASVASDAIMDENLIDIDTTLMRFADVILPALDRVLWQGAGASGATKADSAAAGARVSGLGSQPQRPGSAGEDAGGSQMALSTRPVEGLPYDHRLGRLYETIGRLHTIMVSLLRVRYLSVPSSVRQRSSGDTELLFDTDDCIDNGFVDLDLDKLVRVSAAAGPADDDAGTAAEPERFSREGKRTSGSSADARQSGVAVPLARVSANNDLIFRVAAQNLDCVYQSMRKFSSSHKMAAILIQKDTDLVQDRVAAMLEKYSELDVEQAFGHDRAELHGMYALLKERGTRQKGCYFFNRIGGEGECVWARALERLGDGFGGLIEKLVDRTAAAARARELVGEVVDLCAAYVSWAEVAPLPPGHELPEEVLRGCVREGADGSLRAPPAGGDGGSPAALRGRDALAGSGSRPPKPTAAAGTQRTPAEVASATSADLSRATEVGRPGDAPPKVSHFAPEELVRRVVANMFQVAQAAVEGSARARELQAGAQRQHVEQLEGELRLLREAAGAAERRAAQLEQEKEAAEAERNRASSEAAVARAEMRRWKRLVETKRAEVEGSTPKRITGTNGTGEAAGASAPQVEQGQEQVVAPAAGEDAGPQPDYLKEMLQYMRALSQELHFAHHVTGRGGPGERRRGDGDEEVGTAAARAGRAASDEDLSDGDSVAAREAHRLRLQEQLRSPSLRVVADPGYPGYASALRRGAGGPGPRARRTTSLSGSTARTPCASYESYTNDGTPRRVARGAAGDVYAAVPFPTPTAGEGELRASREDDPYRRAASRTSSLRRSPASGVGVAYPRHPPRSATRASSAGRGAAGLGRVFADAAPPTPQEAYFDVDPLMPAAPVSSGRAWLQSDRRPRWRHASPDSAAAASTTGTRSTGLADALGAIRQGGAEEEAADVAGADRRRTPSANTSTRMAALRRLAEVVSSTKVTRPREARC